MEQINGGRDNGDRILINEFKKREAENPGLTKSLVEKFLQESKRENEKRDAEVSHRRTRRRSGTSQGDLPKSRTREENLEMMILDLHCPQCHRIFKDEEEAKDMKENRHHFCFTDGNLRAPLNLLRPTSSPTKQSLSLTCSICPKSGSVVFADQEELKKHIVLAHKAKFFKEEIEKKKKQGRSPGDLRCIIENCDFLADSLEESLIHLGVFHGKLFHALKHDKSNNYQYICKSLFPVKFKNSDHNWKFHKSKTIKPDPDKACPSSSPVKVEKRKLDLEQSAGPSKVAKGEEKTLSATIPVETQSAQKSSNSVSDNEHKSLPSKPLGLSTRTQKSIPGESEPKISQESSGQTVSPSKPKRMKSEMCSVCGETLSNVHTLLCHQAVEHFSEQISREVARPAEEREGHHPCPFPQCKDIFAYQMLRTQHLGIKHGLVQQFMSNPKVVDAAKARVEKEKKREGTKRNSEERDPARFTCKKCDTEFPTPASKSLHTCNSLLDRPPVRDRRSSAENPSVDEEEDFITEKKKKRRKVPQKNVLRQ